MLNLVRHIPISKPIGTTSDIYLGNQPAKVGDVAEITDPNGNTLNVAKVIDIYQKDDDNYMTVKMIA